MVTPRTFLEEGKMAYLKTPNDAVFTVDFLKMNGVHPVRSYERAGKTVFLAKDIYGDVVLDAFGHKMKGSHLLRRFFSFFPYLKDPDRKEENLRPVARSSDIW